MEIEICYAPLLDMADVAMELLVSSFGYGNYCFRRALSGWGDSGLQTSIAICCDQDGIKGLSLALYDKNDPRIAIFGPIAVDESFRNNGIGREIAVKALSHLQEVGVKAVYIGVKEGHSARNLYRRIGFQEYSGVVMRRMFAEANKFESDYFKLDHKLQVRQPSWADYPKFQFLFSYPCKMKAFDCQKGYLSTRYVPQRKFLGVFPEMMEKLESGAADIRVLVVGQKESVVGVSIAQKTENPGLEGVNVDFFVHDNFLGFSGLLFEPLIKNEAFSEQDFHSRCLMSDTVRKEVLEKNNYCQSISKEVKVQGYGKENMQNYVYSRSMK